ncbi:MAG TPA: hypothetical protein VJ728_01980, partial [Candidatus Binataceae bacterium]|nr:hypothetical protein [Candidatus Binataceae bacterium]
GSSTTPNYEVHTPNAVAAARGTFFDTFYTNNAVRPGFNGCHQFTDVLVYNGTVAVKNVANPASPTIQLRAGQRTTVPCGAVPLAPSSLTAVASGVPMSDAAIAATATAGAAIIAGGVVGGYAAAGGFSNSPISHLKKAITPTM